jgi:hypothetical protein
MPLLCCSDETGRKKGKKEKLLSQTSVGQHRKEKVTANVWRIT